MKPTYPITARLLRDVTGEHEIDTGDRILNSGEFPVPAGTVVTITHHEPADRSVGIFGHSFYCEPLGGVDDDAVLILWDAEPEDFEQIA